MPKLRRDTAAQLLALASLLGVAVAFGLTAGTRFLMPGPMTSAHGGIEACSACHTNSGTGKLGWVHGLVAGDPRADSKACLACHKMPDTAFNAHGASVDVLQKSTLQLTKIAAGRSLPPSARAQSVAFPMQDVISGGLFCATCHQEHQGSKFDLKRISDEQCRSCHVVKFDSFDGSHPNFDSYPFKKRTPIIYDHAGHFGKHYPEIAKKEPEKRIPETCASCHDSRADKRVMSVVPFEQVCAGCHLDQITGKTRASGPKGVAFLSLPGLDLETLAKKKAPLGEWPDASDAALTPFMKVMIGRNDKGRALIASVANLNLQDLGTASDEQIKSVTDLAWEIKRLLHALISGKASDVLADLNIATGAKLSPSLVADLTASLPRDVIVGAQQEWLPNLAQEIAGGPISPAAAAAKAQSNPTPPVADEPPAPQAQQSDAGSEPATEETAAQPEGDGKVAANKVKLDPPTCVLRVLGACVMFKDPNATAPPPDTANDAAGGAQKTEAAPVPSTGQALSEPMRAGLRDIVPAASPKRAENVSDKKDDLLFPTEEERRELTERRKAAGSAARPARGPPGGGAESAAEGLPADGAAPMIAIDSGVDPESWAEYGGWYRQDFAISYRPIGHKDKFLYSWLFLTGPQAPRGSTSPAAGVFDVLTNKDAQGACTKCHSVDDIAGKGRAVNFAQPSAQSKKGRFTNFIHEPHLGMTDERGCLTCHSLEKGQAYLKSYEQGDAHKFVPAFGAIKKDVCQTCHTSSKAGQDCLVCHKYHVDGAVTPVMSTKLRAP